MSALNSLQVHEVHIKDEKQLLNTFKGGNDLRSQINNLNNTKNNTLKNTSLNNAHNISTTKPTKQTNLTKTH